MVPSPVGAPRAAPSADCGWLDGLVLMGGSDVWPGSYGESPLDPRWQGDRVRDEYEIALARSFMAAGKPVFGVCRGLQLINVALGGTLWQDIATQHPGARTHRDAELYDRLFHEVAIVPGSRLAQLYPNQARSTVNSVHHQGIRQLAAELDVEARCPDDDTIEAVRGRGRSYVAAVQWHPEFHDGVTTPTVIDDAPILADFLTAARAARATT
jgi:putative glutamine amidotransferase